MNSALQIRLEVSPQQAARLRALQIAFAEVCNALAPVVRRTRCWNRVALHHMTYRSLRERFPQLGSQMICNAIYSVSRTSRIVYQASGSPFNLTRLGDRTLPLIRFASHSPVYFDRHTLSFRDGHLSMFTLDGRMRFEIGLSRAVERRFQEEKLQEIVLTSRGDEFTLLFVFGGARSRGAAASRPAAGHQLPEYVLVMPSAPGESEPDPEALEVSIGEPE